MTALRLWWGFASARTAPTFSSMRHIGSSRAVSTSRPRRFQQTERRRALAPIFKVLESNLASHLDRGVILAVSGGPDSRALMECVAQWPGRAQGKVYVASVAHGHRAAARAEAHAVIARARVLGFEGAALMGHAEAPDEATLRSLRYELLAGYAREHQLRAVVLAHHQGDVAEGVFMDVLGEGGGAHGAAMAGTRPLTDDVSLLRPFLSLDKQHLQVALTALGVGNIFIDRSDTRGENARARVRAELKRFEQRAPGTIPRLAARAHERARFGDLVAATARGAIERHGDDLFVPGPRGVHSDSVWRALWETRIRDVLAQAASGRDPRAGRTTLEAAARAILHGDAGRTFQFPGVQVHVIGAHKARLFVEPR